MGRYLKIAVLSAIVVSSGIYSDNRFHVQLYNYTKYSMKATAYFTGCDTPTLSFTVDAAKPNKDGKIGDSEATMGHVDVTNCTHTHMKVIVQTPGGEALLEYYPNINKHVWYQVKIDPDVNCKLDLIYSKSGEPNRIANWVFYDNGTTSCKNLKETIDYLSQGR